MKTKRIPFNVELAKAGAKVVTRDGHKVDIIRFDERDYYPISGWIRASQLIGDSDEYASFTEEGYYISSNNEDCRDLFIEEEAEETDDYYPYKATVKSIADMVERYAELQSLEELKDFYNNVRIKCRDAFDYGNVCMINQDDEPADNKPKFQKGDWVIDKLGRVQKITDVRKNIIKHIYEYNTISYSFGILSYGYFNENIKDIRLWNIKEKPGDVLASREYVVLFKEIDRLNIKCYCSYYFINTPNFCANITLQGKSLFQPATKEQCDILFKKIKEAGYEWDSNKKELHKIEKVKTRRMTHQELSWWLRDHPEEHREYSHEDGRYVQSGYYDYFSDDANVKVEDGILIRRNGGEWEEPLIEI